MRRKARNKRAFTPIVLPPSLFSAMTALAACQVRAAATQVSARVHLRRRFDERLLTTHLSLRSDPSVQCPAMIGPNGRPGNVRSGKDAEAPHQEIMMLTKVAAALVAVTMFTAPVLAQSVAPASPTLATQTIKAKSPVKHVKVKKHTVKKVRVARHHMQVKHVRHAKSATLSHSARLSTKPAPVQSRNN